MSLDDSDSKDESDFLSTNGEDVDVYLNCYRIPKLSNGFGPKNGCSDGASTSRGSLKNGGGREQVVFNDDGIIMSLTELAAQKVACHLPFGQVERFQPPVPEPMQCRIAFWSFPQDEEDIRLYTCLANGSADVFIRAEDLISWNYVCDMLQVGFHLSANVKSLQDSKDNTDCFRVAVTFDRRRITSCSCSCTALTFWCEHTVAVCLQRIRKPQELTLRAPVSESLQRLEKNQLQKFAQYLINELPQQILPAAQKLLDELLSGDEALINQNPAAPDPTAGATINEQTSWCLDDTHLSLDIKKILHKQCTTQPTVCSDVQSLHTIAPPAATEYSQLLRPIRGREPEGLWNLISIVGEMMRRRDSNYLLLLEIMTQEVLRCDKVVTWWFETKVSLQSGSTIHYTTLKNNSNSSNNSHTNSGNNINQGTSQYSCSNFCDEIVHLWRLAAMDPNADPLERKRLYDKLFEWHLDILKRHTTVPEENSSSIILKVNNTKRNFLELFPGFKPAMEGCLIEWNDWDTKRNCFTVPDESSDTNKTKSTKSNKKKKKKSKSAKQQNLSDLKPSTSDAKENINELELTEKIIENSLVGVEREQLEETSKNNVENLEIENLNHVEALQKDPLLEIQDQEPVFYGPEPQPDPPIEQDLQVYYMQNPPENLTPEKSSKPESLEDYIKINQKKLKDTLEIIYAKTEGLYAHGHTDLAKNLASKAAMEILNYPNYPNVKQLCTLPRRKKKKGSLDNPMSIAASEALSKIAFLCNVLLEDSVHHNLVFKLVFFGIEMKRSPAATKPLEVKLINQKHDLINLLKSITLHEEELNFLREKAQALRDGDSENFSNAFTTIILGNYIFEALVLSKSINPQSRCVCLNCQPTRVVNEATRSNASSSYNSSNQYHPIDEHYLAQNDQQVNLHACDRQPSSLIAIGKAPSDLVLGFYAALNALGAKLNLSEGDHPLLCEGIRRQRGELALSLLIHYKDDQEKLDLILKYLLDKDVISNPQLTNIVTVPTLEQTEQRAKKNSTTTQDPNQPTEASAYFMFELAKTVFDKAGGNSTTTHLFRPQLVTQNGSRGIHRRLHMCALRIALYALGLQNKTSNNWMQRTYNGRASFIHEQALEIGLPAIKFLCENWDGYLTPVEAASIADKAGCSNDAETKRVAAEMAKSCLRYANYLESNAVRRILSQCIDQSVEMIEEACNEIEQIAETDNVCADVLFAAARAWYDLYDKLVKADGENNCCHTKDSFTMSHEQQQDIGAADWSTIANGNNTSQEYKCPHHYYHHHLYTQQLNEIDPIHTNHHGRTEYIPTTYTPTYKYIEYVKAAYRVGLKALDALKPAVHLGSKHNPQKEDEIIWLLYLSKILDRILGTEYLHRFGWSANKNITNPHTLSVICIDLIKYFELRGLPAHHIDRVNILLPLIYKCLERFKIRTRDLMKHVTHDQKSYIDSILDVAQNLTIEAYTLTAAKHYKELLKVVETKKSKKFRLFIDTKEREKIVNDLLYEIQECGCVTCRANRDYRIKF